LNRFILFARVTPDVKEAARARWGRGLADEVRRQIADGAPRADFSRRHVGQVGLRNARVPIRLGADSVEELNALAASAGLFPAAVLGRIVEQLAAG